MKRHHVLYAVAIVASFLGLRAVHAQGGPQGVWDATVKVGAADVPFRFEIAHHGDQWIGYFFEGDSRIRSTTGTFNTGMLTLTYENLNTTLTASFDGSSLTGSYRSNRKNGREYPFHAVRRTDPPSGPADPSAVAGEWEMKLIGEDRSPTKDSRAVLSWNLYLRQAGGNVSGSILRVDGDTGTLTGGWRGDTLVLSHFAGERPVLFEGRLQPDGTLKIVLNRQNEYLAARTSDAQSKGIPTPADPTQFTHVSDPSQPFHFSFPDVKGHTVSDSDARFKGQVVILAVEGSWCPNCRDEAPFLVDLYHRYHAQGVEVVGLSFEATGDEAEDKPRIASYIREFSVPYPVLYAGSTHDVQEKLPQLADFDSFPTTIYLDRSGRVASIHAGFASAATGGAHVALEREARALVEQLLTSSAAAN